MCATQLQSLAQTYGDRFQPDPGWETLIMNVTRTPRRFQSADQLADAVVEKVGRNIVLALPLGLGKADHIANALLPRWRQTRA